MSADNWRECPKCEAKATEDRLVKYRQAAEAYGKVPSEEWQRMTAAAGAAIELEDTLREDYQQGIYEREDEDELGYHVYYSARCEQEGCGFKFEYEHHEPVKL